MNNHQTSERQPATQVGYSKFRLSSERKGYSRKNSLTDEAKQMIVLSSLSQRKLHVFRYPPIAFILSTPNVRYNRTQVLLARHGQQRLCDCCITREVAPETLYSTATSNHYNISLPQIFLTFSQRTSRSSPEHIIR